MKYSIEEFAEEIRKLFPGDYGDLKDNDLVELWLKKYPQDAAKIALNTEYTEEEFAQEIRKLFPGEYDDLSDIELVRLWLKKYPQDSDKIDINLINSIKVQHFCLMPDLLNFTAHFS